MPRRLPRAWVILRTRTYKTLSILKEMRVTRLAIVWNDLPGHDDSMTWKLMYNQKRKPDAISREINALFLEEQGLNEEIDELCRDIAQPLRYRSTRRMEVVARPRLPIRVILKIRRFRP